MVFRQLVEALLQGISQEVEFLTGLIKTSLSLERGRRERGTKEGKEEVRKNGKREKHQLHGPFYFSGAQQQRKDWFHLKAVKLYRVSSEENLFLTRFKSVSQARWMEDVILHTHTLITQTSTSECALFSVTFPEPRSFMTFLAPSATADSILA